MPSHELENAETMISRPTFPQREEMPSPELESPEIMISKAPPLKGENPMTLDEERASTDIEDSSDESEDEDPRWTNVKRKRAQSLDSAKKNLINKKIIYLNPSTLSTEQGKAVEAATNLLTQGQKDQLQRRQNKTQHNENNAEPGPSRKKGKAVDPREWGNAGIDPEEMDINIQEAMLNDYKKGRKKAEKNTKRHKKAEDSSDESEDEEIFQMPPVSRQKSIASANLEVRRAGSKPAAQIVPDSSLGVALGNLAKLNKDPGDSGPSDDSSDYESSIYSRSTRSYSSSRSRRKRRRNSKRRSSKRRSKRKTRRDKRADTSIKPIPPKDYDGAADARAYHRFVMEGEAYLRDGKVHRERQIRILAHYLDGKAYSFYMQKVASDDPNNWSLHQFFTELFNYCFPVDYRQQMRLKLESFYQKQNQTISEYIFELQELFSMVGAMPEEMKIIKLWYSLNTRTQRAMWRDGLHPDSSTWDEIVAKAEMVEIANSVIDSRDRNKPQAQRPISNYRNNNNFDNNYKRSHDSASRSVTYTNRGRDNGRSHQSNQSRSANQPRQDSAQPSAGRFQSRRPIPRPNKAGVSSPAKKKSVKFADLSEAEMAQLRAEGKCFRCKEPGHMSRNCPTKNTVRGNGNNKPPGVPSYSMNMTIIEDNDSQDNASVLSSMPVGSINMESIEEIKTASNEDWRKWYPTWKNPQALAREQIGDCYEMTAEYLLTILQPYPGDDLSTISAWKSG
jgi:hypothetical protein